MCFCDEFVYFHDEIVCFRRVADFVYLGRIKDLKSVMKTSTIQSRQMGKRENKVINIDGRVQFDLLQVPLNPAPVITHWRPPTKLGEGSFFNGVCLYVYRWLGISGPVLCVLWSSPLGGGVGMFKGVGGMYRGCPCKWNTTGYGWQAGGTHPSGMLSCSWCVQTDPNRLRISTQILRFIYIGKKSKNEFFVAAECEHLIRFSVNPPGSDAAFALIQTAP